MSVATPRHAAPADPFAAAAAAWSGPEDAAIFGVDLEGRLRFANAAFEAMVGWAVEPFYGRAAPWPWFHESDVERIGRQLEACLRGELEALGVAGVQCLARHRSGRDLELVVSGTRMRDAEGRDLGFLGVAQEIGSVDGTDPDARSEVREAAAQLMRAAAVVQHSLLAGGSGDREARLTRLPGYEALSGREREVLRRLGDGLRVSTIAVELGIRPATVRNHLKSIYRKTGLHSQTRLVSALRREG